MTDAQFVLSPDELAALRREALPDEPTAPEEVELGRSERSFRRRMLVIEPRLTRVPIAATALLSKALGGACTLDAMRGEVTGPSACLQSLQGMAYVVRLVVGDDTQAGLLALNPPLCFGLIERAFGAAISMPREDAEGKPGFRLARRTLTAVEHELVRPLVTSLADIISDALNCPHDQRLALVPLAAGTEPEIDSDVENALVWRMTVRMGRFEAQVALVVLPALVDLALGIADQRKQPVDPKWIARHIARSSVELTAVLGRAHLNLAEILGLRVGDVLRLDQGQRDTIAVMLERCTKYRGRPVQLGGVFGVEIVQEEPT